MCSLMASFELFNYLYIHLCIHIHITTFNALTQKLFTENLLLPTLVLGTREALENKKSRSWPFQNLQWEFVLSQSSVQTTEPTQGISN